MPEWIDPPPPTAPEALKEAVGGHPLVAELLARRGIRAPEAARAFMDPEAYEPASPFELPDMREGARRVLKAIEEGERVLVWGDFDVDGQTSTALLVEALTEVGGEVVYHIPHRERESHGVNAPYLRRYLEEGIDLVLTCDTGVSSHEALRLARQEGTDVVVTDHHDLPEELPEAEAIINPKRLEARHPLRTLPGVGVAYKLAEALAEGARADDLGRDELGAEENKLQPEKYLEPEKQLDLVALGIVADIARLAGDTRYLLQRGLKALRGTRRPGLLAVMENASVPPEAADEEDIAYRIGPRLNALGRLADASVSVPLLTTDDTGRAREIAGRLEEINDRRRLLTGQVYEAAKQKIRESPELLQYAALVLYGEKWPAGVIGIVASRLLEEYHKPTILLTAAKESSNAEESQAEESSKKEGSADASSPRDTGGQFGPDSHVARDKMARGSARSIEEIDISAAIAGQSDLLESYGGHPMAAGLTLPVGEVERFRRLVSRSIVQQKDGKEIKPTLQIDSYLPLEELTLRLVDDLQRLAPFGPGNRPVTLACRNLQVKEVEEIGASGDHLKVKVTDPEGTEREVLYWNASRRDLSSGAFDLAVNLSDNVFRGERSVQITWEDMRRRRNPSLGDSSEDISSKEASSMEESSLGAPSVGSPSTEQIGDASPRRIIDHREAEDLGSVLQTLSRRDGMQIWMEACSADDVDGRTREELTPCEELAIGMLPPSPDVLDEVIETCDPEAIHLVGIDPEVDDLEAFARRLLGLSKHAIKTERHFSIEELAAAMGHEKRTVRLGLKWLESQGEIRVTPSKEGIRLSEGQERGEVDSEDFQALEEALEEAKAFRRYTSKEGDRVFPSVMEK